MPQGKLLKNLANLEAKKLVHKYIKQNLLYPGMRYRCFYGSTEHVSIIETIHQELTANGNKYNVTGELINLRIMDYLTKLRKDMELWMRVAPKDSIVHGYTPVHLDCAAVILMEDRREQLRDYFNKDLLKSGCGFSLDKAKDMLAWANRAWEANGDSNRMVDIKNPEYKEDPAEGSHRRDEPQSSDQAEGNLKHNLGDLDLVKELVQKYIKRELMYPGMEWCRFKGSTEHENLLKAVHRDLSASGGIRMTDSLLKKTINNLISDFLRQLRKEVALWMRTAPKDSIVHGYDLSHLDSAAETVLKERHLFLDVDGQFSPEKAEQILSWVKQAWEEWEMRPS